VARRDARHAYAVLRGLTHPGGGTVAATSTGLPERANRGRNYDYRFVWVRDQCFAGQAVAVDRPHTLLDDAVRFVSDRLLTDGPNLAPAYTVDGGPVPPERDAGLPGYPGGTGMLGNHVRSQFQLDTFGEALLLFAAAARHDRLDTDHWRAATTAVSAITERWRGRCRGVGAPAATLDPLPVDLRRRTAPARRRRRTPGRRRCLARPRRSDHRRRDVAADPEPGCRGGCGAVAAADLHLGLGGADVALGLVVLVMPIST
jgi:hypothetical protein